MIPATNKTIEIRKTNFILPSNSADCSDCVEETSAKHDELSSRKQVKKHPVTNILLTIFCLYMGVIIPFVQLIGAF